MREWTGSSRSPPSPPVRSGTGGEGHAPPERPTPAGPEIGTRLSAKEIHENVLEAAVEELRRPVVSLFWSAIAAGLVIGWSFVAAGFLASISPAPARHAAAAAAYPLGFILVIIGRNQLFTENTLEPVIPVLEHRSLSTLRAMFRLWGLVLIGNLVGAMIFGVLLAHTPMIDAAVYRELTTIGQQALDGGFALIFYRAIFAGWLIALTAWLVSATQMTGAQIALIWLTTAPISAFGFRHSVAGAVEAFFMAVGGHASWGVAIGGFIVPAVLGNVVGGVLFVALINHGQVAAERRARGE
jgi:formate/nitrite transporter FocA (FNT family)